MKDSHYSFFSRLLFFVAVVLSLVAVWDWLLRLFGYSLPWLPYGPWRLVEFAAVVMIFVIALLLRQIRDHLRAK